MKTHNKLRIGLLVLLILAVLSLFGFRIAEVLAGPMELVSLRTQNSKVYHLGGERYKVRASQGPIHYRDEAGKWADIDLGATVQDEGDFSVRWEKLPYVVRMGQDGYRCIYPDRNDLSYWVCMGKPFPVMPTPTKAGETWTWAWANAEMRITVGPGAVKLGFLLLEPSAPASITFPLDVHGMVRDGTYLRHKGSGKVVAVLSRPWAIDAEGVERAVDFTITADSLTLSLDTSGLTYPIDIDPSVTLHADASANDGHEYGTGYGTYTGNQDSVWGTAAGQGDASYRASLWRFPNVAVVKDSTVSDAHMYVINVENFYYDFHADVHAEYVGDCDDLATNGDIFVGAGARTRTTDAVHIDATMTKNVAFDIDLIDGALNPIEETLAHSSWASGNDLCIIAMPNVDETTQAYVRSYDGSTARCTSASTSGCSAGLEFTYTAPGGTPTPTPIVSGGFW